MATKKLYTGFNSDLSLEIICDILQTPIMCFGRLVNICHYAMQCIKLNGEYVEFGCYTGKTACLISSISGKSMYLYDSFDGIPDLVEQDAHSDPFFEKGELKCKQQDVKKYFKSKNVVFPKIKKAWFNELKLNDVPQKISFAHLDGDLYQSIKDSLDIVYPRLVRGAACIIDDYGWKGLRGAKIAADEYMKDKKEKVIWLNINNKNASHGVIIKG